MKTDAFIGSRPIVLALYVLAAAAGGALVVAAPGPALIAGGAALALALLTRLRIATALLACTTVTWGVSIFAVESSAGGAGGAAGTLGLGKLLPLAILGALALATWRPGVLTRLPPAAWLAIAYFTWLGFAAVFSPDPLLSCGRILQGAGPLVVVLVVRRATGGTVALFAAAGAALLAHVVWALVSPRYVGVTGDERLVGLLIANSFGYAAGIVAVLGILVWQSDIVGRASLVVGLTMVACGSLAITLGVSRTAVIAVPVAIAAALSAALTARVARRKARLLLLGLAVGVVLVLPAQQPAITEWFANGDVSVATLTGRTTAWSELVPQALDRPLVGLGPGVLRFDSEVETGITVGALLGQAHNSLVEALVSGGVPAAVLWTAMMLAFAAVAASVVPRYRVVAVGVWAASCVFAITTGQLAGFGMPWFMLVSLLALPREELGVDPPPAR